MKEAMWANARNLLCVRLDAMGDVLMTGPAIRALKESAPGRRITLLTSEAGAKAASLMPEIDDVITYNAPWMKQPTEGSEADLAMMGQIASRSFDAAVIFTVFSQNPLPAALCTYLAGTPLRLAHCRENPYHLLTHWVPEVDNEASIRHEVRRQLDLVASVGCRPGSEELAISIPEVARARARRMLEIAGIAAGRPWIAVHPGASAPSRRYPAGQFADVCARLALEDGLSIVFTGTEQEGELVGEVQRAMAVPSVSMAGRLSIGETAALISEAPLLLSNNTGVVHIAAATRTPTVVLYALTNPQHTPWKVESRVLSQMVPCRYCYKSVCPEGHHACLREVASDDVLAAVRDLLYGWTADAHSGIGPYRRDCRLPPLHS